MSQIIETGRPCADILDVIAEDGCIAHKGDPAGCDGPNSARWYSTNDLGDGRGDLWCERAYRQHLDAAPGIPTVEQMYGVTGEAAQWIRDNVGLN